MPKKKKQKWVFPPHVFWISPQGEVLDIIGHLTAIQHDPHEFNLTYPPQTESEIDEAFDYILKEGWIRGRVSEPNVYFYFYRLSRNVLQNITDFLLFYQVPEMWVANFDFHQPTHKAMPISIPVRDFLEGRYPSYWERNPKKRKKYF